MSVRWWAPKQASLSPDAVVLALLEPGGDPAGDLGASLLAAHRAGAAACESVAKGAVPSRAGLVMALAGVREQLADPLVTAIAKSVDSPSYAGLLARDVFDDAEACAISLYGSATTAGVSPPMAASRVGAVFGVPSSALGRYQSMACDPKANLAALTDAADRCLLTHVAKTVGIETTHLESVSKAGVAQFDPNEHPRGAAGRFRDDSTQSAHGRPPQEPTIADPHLLAQLRGLFGGGSQAAPEVGTTPAKKRQQRQSRQVRRTRLVRRVPKQSVKQSVKQDIRQSIKQVPDRIKTDRQALRQANPPQVPVITTLGSRALARVPDLLEMPNPNLQFAPSNTYDLYQSLTIPVPGQISHELHTTLRENQALQADPTEKIFRIGNLLSMAGHPQAQISGRNDAKKDANRLAVEELDDAGSEVWNGNRIDKGYLPPTTRRIKDQDVLPGFKMPTLAQTATFYEHERTKDITTYHQSLSGQETEELDELENGFVAIYPEYVPLGTFRDDEDDPQDYGDKFVVHYNPADPTRPRYRPRPAIAEYVIESDARGYEEGLPDNPDKVSFVLDPNVAYKVIRPPSFHDIEVPGPEVMWDNSRQLVVNRYYIQAISDDEVAEITGSDQFNKADSGYQEREHPRDADGQWARVRSRPAPSTPGQRPETTPEEQEPVQRQSRQIRRARQVRRRRLVANQRQVIRQDIRQDLKQTVKQHPLFKAIRAAMARVPNLDDRPALPPLSDTGRYLVFKHDENGYAGHEGGVGEYDFDLIDDYKPGSAPFSVLEEHIDSGDLSALWNFQPIRLNATARELVLSSKPLPVSRLGPVMQMNTEEELWPTGASVGIKPIGSMPYDIMVGAGWDDENLHRHRSDTGTGLDHGAIAKKVAELFASNRDLDQVQMSPEGRRLVFYGNDKPASAQHLIQVDPDLDIDDPMEMTYLGEYRAHELTYELDGNLEDVMSLGFEHNDANVTSAKMHYFKITRPLVRRSIVRNAPRVHDFRRGGSGDDGTYGGQDAEY